MALGARLCVFGLVLLGCAPAFPSFSGGRTVPRGRSDLALGAAVRVPVGDLADAPMLTDTAPGGALPVAFVRHGLGPDADLGLEVAGSGARGMLRGQLREGLVRFIGGFAPHVGVAHEQGDLLRVGGTVPLTLSIDAFSLYEVWVGLRVGVEHLVGEVGGNAVSMTGLRTGGVVGLGVGFRRLSLLVELGIDHELWSGDVSDISIATNGVVLTPAFAFRIRL